MATESKELQGYIKPPEMSHSAIVVMVERLYGLTVIRSKVLYGYYDRNYFLETEDICRNPYIKQVWPHGYVFKVMNKADSLKQHAEAEHEIQKLLKNEGINCPSHVLNVHGHLTSVEEITSQDGPSKTDNTGDDGAGCSIHKVRLLTFVPGETMSDSPSAMTPDLLFDIGKSSAKFTKTLQDYSHPSLVPPMWSLDSVPKLTDYMHYVKDPQERQLLEEVVSAFNKDVIPRCHSFCRGVIHGDFHNYNIILQKHSSPDHPAERHNYKLYGIIDFAECCQSCHIFDLGITVMHLMTASKQMDPFMVGGYVLAGYTSVSPLSDAELDAFKLCLAARFAQILVLGYHSVAMDPTNAYILEVGMVNSLPLLQQLWAMPKQELYNKWKHILDLSNDNK